MILKTKNKCKHFFNITVYFVVKVNNVKVKVKLTLEQALKAQRGSRGIALLCL
jgi:hypothetical protein